MHFLLLSCFIISSNLVQADQSKPFPPVLLDLENVAMLQISACSLSTDTDDLTLTLKASTDLVAWNNALLEFIDSIDMGNGKREFRFRVNSVGDRQFFRTEVFQDTTP